MPSPGKCGNCNIDMTVYRETESSWVFKCRRCGRLSAVMKRIIGGTTGSGKPDDGSTGITGRGWKPR